MFVQILVDDRSSWIIPFAQQLTLRIKTLDISVELIYSQTEIKGSDILFLLGCTKVLSAELLKKSKSPVLVHESDLPRGKGWSPLTWQVLEGKNQIPVCLIEAAAKVDSGRIFLKRHLSFSGHELLDELKQAQGEITIDLCLEFLQNYGKIQAEDQSGQESFYSRRNPESSRLNPRLSLEEQFNLLRVCDNERYPAFFEHNHQKYIIKIYKA
jgi:methionyl-tRNA formyltransferase